MTNPHIAAEARHDAKFMADVTDAHIVYGLHLNRGWRATVRVALGNGERDGWSVPRKADYWGSKNDVLEYMRAFEEASGLAVSIERGPDVMD